MRNLLFVLALGVALLPGCASPDGATAAEQIAYTLSVRDEALRELYQRDPGAEAKIDTAAGYLFFSGFAIHPGFCTLANGYGIVQDNKSGKQTHIRMNRFAIGPGIAVKGYYAVATLPNTEAVEAFAKGSWYGGCFAEASFQFGDTGGTSAAETASAQTDMWMWTHTGVALEVAAGGGKIYPNDELN